LTSPCAHGSEPVPFCHGLPAARGDSLAALVVLVVVALFAAGCDDDSAGTARKGKERVRIAIVGQSRDDPTWPVIQATAAWFGDRYRLASVETLAPETLSPGEQKKLLAGLVDRPFDAVCVVVFDSDAVRASIQELVRHGKRVVTIGRDVPGSERYAHCGPSEFDVGRAAAQACAMVLRGRAPTIMLLHAGVENDAYASRYYAFKNELPLMGDLQLLSEVDCAGRQMDAAHLVRVEARRYPRAGCWVLLDDWPLRAIPETDRLLPLGGGIVLCDGSPRYWPRLRDGQILAMITYDFRRAVEESLLAGSRGPTDVEEIRNASYTPPTEIITVRELESFEQRWKLWQQSGQSAEWSRRQTAPAQSQAVIQPASKPASSTRPQEKRPQGP
jgi:ABC-type sugar transport system substrate-binding protein